MTKSADGKGFKNGGPDNCVCFHCGQPGHLKKDCPLGPYCLCCDTRGHTPAKCVLTKKGNSRMKHTKVGTSNLKKDAKTGRGHKTSHNIRIQRTSACTVQVITGHMIVQQDINTRCLLAVQISSLFSMIFKSFTPTTFSAESGYSWIINTDIDG